MSISKELVRRYDQLMQSHGANQPLGYSGSDTGGRWVGRRMGDIVEKLREITNTPIVEQKIRWLQDYDLEVEGENSEGRMMVEKNSLSEVKILNCQQWGNIGENIYDIQFSDGRIAPGVYGALFEFTDTITVAGDIPNNTVTCPNECDGGDICVDTKTGKCDFCGQYFNIVSTKIEVKV